MDAFALDDGILWLSFAAVLLLVAVVAVVALLDARRRTRALDRRCEVLEKELAQLRAGALGMGQRLLALEKRPATQAEGDADTPRGYREASHLLAAGVSPEEVASRCGLSRAEASLLDALRKRDASRG